MRGNTMWKRIAPIIEEGILEGHDPMTIHEYVNQHPKFLSFDKPPVDVNDTIITYHNRRGTTIQTASDLVWFYPELMCKWKRMKEDENKLTIELLTAFMNNTYRRNTSRTVDDTGAKKRILFTYDLVAKILYAVAKSDMDAMKAVATYDAYNLGLGEVDRQNFVITFLNLCKSRQSDARQIMSMLQRFLKVSHTKH